MAASTATATATLPATAPAGAPPSVRSRWAPYWQAAPLTAVFLVFFILPLLATFIVSFWNYTEYSIEPDFKIQNYIDVFDKCVSGLPDLCTTFKTYISTLKFCLIVWLSTLVLGFTVSYYIAFEIRRPTTRLILALVCTIPFWTSNVIRMISWIPLLGRNGLINQMLIGLGIVRDPQDWLLYSDFSVILAFVHLNTVFMIVPIVNSMSRIDRSLIEAAYDVGATGWQTLTNVVIPLCKTGIAIGSIFVITVVMGDFITIGLMGGQQIASIGKTINVEISYLQFPIAAANAIILLAVVMMIIAAMVRFVDIRKEL
ncbi:ABC transporter permease [Labrys monachus]|uniref:Spermidine/putrescine transport system permease protein n=1 Tax=Labrys monachus TaxID=217067 RepID=A0ABU0FAC0_9HYPH|nr:ABC transporter permease [Labrys monachus]MDQ0391381.1 putative spermidine/putrescine transport system permease protein [Labrys monachus]